MTIADRYAGIVLDIDGVLCRGRAPVPRAIETVAALRDVGVGLVFATNNAARTPEQVSAWLRELGFAVSPAEVVTSPLATAALLSPGERCLVVGADGLHRALREAGCSFTDDPAQAETVVVGFTRELVWDDLRRATLALTNGARFVGTNGDVSFPSSEGIWPGNGAILAALEAASGRRPEIAGKPERALFDTAAAKLPSGRLLMVGDRVETDILGAGRLGWDTALVLTGVSTAADLQDPVWEPTWLLPSVAGLLDDPPAGRPPG